MKKKDTSRFPRARCISGKPTILNLTRSTPPLLLLLLFLLLLLVIDLALRTPGYPNRPPPYVLLLIISINKCIIYLSIYLSI